MDSSIDGNMRVHMGDGFQYTNDVQGRTSGFRVRCAADTQPSQRK
jgi:hypothetical protein